MTEESEESVMVDATSSFTQPKPRQTARWHAIKSQTITKPPFSYACLELVSESAAKIELDDVMVKSYITAALAQFLGLTGAAISVDILKVDGMRCWIRVPREDLSPLIAAVGGWVDMIDKNEKVGWKVVAKGNWLSSLICNQHTEDVWIRGPHDSSRKS